MLEAAVLDLLPLENSVARARALIAAGLAAVRLLEVEALQRAEPEDPTP